MVVKGQKDRYKEGWKGGRSVGERTCVMMVLWWDEDKYSLRLKREDVLRLAAMRTEESQREEGVES